MIDLRFTAAILVPALFLLAVELVGVRRPEAGDTITEHWRWADDWLRRRSPWGRWSYRVFTLGLLAWTAVHLAVGAD